MKALPSETICVQVCHHVDTIADVKAKIQNQQRLLFDGKELKEMGHRPLRIVVSIKNPPFTLTMPYVKTPNSQTKSLEVEPSDTIQNVKEWIQK